VTPGFSITGVLRFYHVREHEDVGRGHRAMQNLHVKHRAFSDSDFEFGQDKKPDLKYSDILEVYSPFGLPLA
jgi:hypothetical protein